MNISILDDNDPSTREQELKERVVETALELNGRRVFNPPLNYSQWLALFEQAKNDLYAACDALLAHRAILPTQED